MIYNDKTAILNNFNVIELRSPVAKHAAEFEKFKKNYIMEHSVFPSYSVTASEENFETMLDNIAADDKSLIIAAFAANKIVGLAEMYFTEKRREVLCLVSVNVLHDYERTGLSSILFSQAKAAAIERDAVMRII